ncbi:hypothetical protein AB0D34_35480 [Streptomyces sp. NPDC048420]|uniref:hypothetical protein n=1 Tax=Streptomyces sp. NPDC048420 TaxID=3155755 RepID=UPI00342AA23B
MSRRLGLAGSGAGVGTFVPATIRPGGGQSARLQAEGVAGRDPCEDFAFEIAFEGRLTPSNN